MHVTGIIIFGLMSGVDKPTMGDSSSKRTKDGFYRVNLEKMYVEVPKRYQEIKLIGCGAFGQVW